MFCREQVAQLRGTVPAIRALGAELVVVGNGGPSHAQHFRDEQKLDFPLLVDPKLQAYEAAGLRRSVLSNFSFGALRSAARALGSGHRQGWTQGDPWQQGGTFVITPDGRTLFSYISREAGDHADVNQVLQVLREIGGATN